MAPKQVFTHHAGDSSDTTGKVKKSYSESAHEMYYFSFYFLIENSTSRMLCLRKYDVPKLHFLD